MQKPAILSAKELGFRCCVIDADENAVCVPLADEFQKIDLKNKEQITEYAKAQRERLGVEMRKLKQTKNFFPQQENNAQRLNISF